VAAIAAVQQQQRCYVAVAAGGVAAAVLLLLNSHKNPSCHVNCVAVRSVAAAVADCRQPAAAAEAQTWLL